MRLIRILLAAMLLHGAVAQAAVTVTVQQVGADVVATASGSLDVSGAVSCGSVPIPALFSWVTASSYAYLVGPPAPAASGLCLGLSFSTAQPLHSALADFIPDSGSGDRFGVESGGSTVNVYVPNGYSSGAPISSSSTWSGQTLAGMGLTPGTYLFDYGDDSVTYNVIAPPVGAPGGPSGATPVPLMPWWVLSGLVALLATVGLAAVSRRPGGG